MPTIQRILPAFHPAYGLAGPHGIGDQVVDFDADGFAEVDDPAVLEAMHQFPETFHVVEPPATPQEGGPASSAEGAAPDSPPVLETPTTGYTAQALDQMSVSDLQQLGAAANVRGVYTLRKRDLIEAILTAQGR